MLLVYFLDFTLIFASYRYGEVTSENLWPRYVRHFVGITWHNVTS